MKFFPTLILLFGLVRLLLVPLDFINFILDEERVRYAFENDIRHATRRLDIHISNIYQVTQEIHLHLNIAQILILGLFSLLIQEKELTLNLNDTSVGQEVDIIYIVDIIEKYGDQ